MYVHNTYAHNMFSYKLTLLLLCISSSSIRTALATHTQLGGYSFREQSQDSVGSTAKELAKEERGNGGEAEGEGGSNWMLCRRSVENGRDGNSSWTDGWSKQPVVREGRERNIILCLCILTCVRASSNEKKKESKVERKKWG